MSPATNDPTSNGALRGPAMIAFPGHPTSNGSQSRSQS